MASPPPPRESKRRRARDVVQRDFLQVKEVFRPSSRPRPHSPSRSSIAPWAATRSLSPAPSGSLNQTATSQGQVENTTEQIPGQSTLSANLALPVITAGPAASPPSTTLTILKDSGNVAWNGLETALRVLEGSTGAFPPLKSAVSGLISSLDIVQAAASNREDYEDLASKLTTMSVTLKEYVSELGQEDYDGSVTLIARSIEAEVECISRQQGRGKTRQLFGSTQDREDVMRRYRRVGELFQQLHIDIGLRTWRDTKKQLTLSLLERMSPVEDARYNSGYSETIKRRGCTAETREKVQRDLQTWVRDRNAVAAYWMNGMAGTGKTTIAYSLCEWLEKNHQLGASFFCSRGLPTCRDIKRIVPTIAYHLARFSPVFRSALCKALENDPNASALNIVWQFEKLVRKPMEMAKESMPEGVIVVLDALDECEDTSGVRLVIETLLRLGADLPVKFFVTSRPEPVIQEKLLSPGGYSPSVLHLHDIEQSIVEADIRKYLKEALGGLLPPPSENEIRQLAKLAGKLFIYAVTVARYILPENIPVNSNARLKAMLAGGYRSMSSTGSSRRYKELDGLYKTILALVFGSEGLEDEDIEIIRLVLWTVVYAEEPLTTQAIASLLDLTAHQVFTALRPLRSVLHVSGDGGLVSTLHASFPDFMLDPQRSAEFHCNKAQHNQLLATRCFDVMKGQLRFNICSLESSFVFDENVPNLDERVNEAIPPALFYACRYFGEHLRQADDSDLLGELLVDFLSRRLLFWMEVLNLKRCIVLGVSALGQAQSWLSEKETSSQVVKQLADARNFVTRFTASACTRSTPHIYISALPFCSKKSTVYEHYWGQSRGLLDIRGTMISRRGEAPLATWMMSSHIVSVAFSLDGTHIVSGCDDSTILLWDAHTGAIMAGPFQGHTDAVWSVAFSPDSTHIVSGSRDATILVWDAHTGAIVTGPFRGHTRAVRSVAFSPNGARVASGSYDFTIVVWDAYTGVVAAGPFQGHMDAIYSVVFSPDGTRIVSGSDDSTIRVWDAHTGVLIADPFRGHTGPVYSAVFSPEGNRIISSSADETIGVWDAHTGVAVAGPYQGHTGSVMQVTFSPDGTRIASCSSDRTIRVWDAHTGVVIAGPFYGHTDEILSVAFSPDGTRLVSSSNDRSIRVWDAHTGIIARGPLEGHSNIVSAVALSPDGTRMVTGSYDRTILVWDVQTGIPVAEPFKGHGSSIIFVAFFPDGTSIISGSWDRKILVWDAYTGVIASASRPLEGYSDPISSVVLSPDGTRMVSGSWDKVLVWDSRTGIIVCGPLQGHSGFISSLAISPDSTRIASGSHDMTILVWDAQTGIPAAGPFKAHTDIIDSVAFSPTGARIVSGSADNTIRVWDTNTGAIVAGPFHGHTGLVMPVKYSSDGTRIISGSENATIRVLDALTGMVLTGPLHLHTDSGINSIAISTDDTRIVYGSSGQTIRMCGLQTGTVPQPITSSADLILSVASSAGSTFTSLNPHSYCDTNPNTNNPLVLGPSSGQHPDYPRILTARRSSATDGWVTVDDTLLFWISPDLHGSLPYPGEPVVIGPQGALQVESWDLLLGDRWAECWVPE